MFCEEKKKVNYNKAKNKKQVSRKAVKQEAN